MMETKSFIEFLSSRHPVQFASLHLFHTQPPHLHLFAAIQVTLHLCHLLTQPCGTVFLRVPLHLVGLHLALQRLRHNIYLEVVIVTLGIYASALPPASSRSYSGCSSVSLYIGLHRL